MPDSISFVLAQFLFIPTVDMHADMHGFVCRWEKMCM